MYTVLEEKRSKSIVQSFSLASSSSRFLSVHQNFFYSLSFHPKGMHAALATREETYRSSGVKLCDVKLFTCHSTTPRLSQPSCTREREITVQGSSRDSVKRETWIVFCWESMCSENPTFHIKGMQRPSNNLRAFEPYLLFAVFGIETFQATVHHRFSLVQQTFSSEKTQTYPDQVNLVMLDWIFVCANPHLVHLNLLRWNSNRRKLNLLIRRVPDRKILNRSVLESLRVTQQEKLKFTSHEWIWHRTPKRKWKIPTNLFLRKPNTSWPKGFSFKHVFSR